MAETITISIGDLRKKLGMNLEFDVVGRPKKNDKGYFKFVDYKDDKKYISTDDRQICIGLENELVKAHCEVYLKPTQDNYVFRNAHIINVEKIYNEDELFFDDVFGKYEHGFKKDDKYTIWGVLNEKNGELLIHDIQDKDEYILLNNSKDDGVWKENLPFGKFIIASGAIVLGEDDKKCFGKLNINEYEEYNNNYVLCNKDKVKCGDPLQPIIDCIDRNDTHSFDTRPFPGVFDKCTRTEIAVIFSDSDNTPIFNDIKGELKFEEKVHYKEVRVPMGNAKAVAEAIQSEDVKKCDILIIAMGGMDAKAFNDPLVLNALNNTPKKQFRVLGIGHSTVVPMAYMYADLKAQVPAVAAELLMNVYTKRKQVYAKGFNRGKEKAEKVFKVRSFFFCLIAGLATGLGVGWFTWGM